MLTHFIGTIGFTLQDEGMSVKFFIQLFLLQFWLNFDNSAFLLEKDTRYSFSPTLSKS